MDTTDPQIEFNDQGICNHCTSLIEKRESLGSISEREALLKQIVNRVKSEGRNKEYDCIIGISGGVDSTYLAMKCKDMGLRPLAVHFDNGWNSELAVKNIENSVKKLGIDLYTYVVDWPQFRDLQISFLLSGTPDTEAPTDHGLRACLYDAALRHKVKYILAGTNLFTEGILPCAWGYGNGDWRYIKSVHRKFHKTSSISSYPHYSLFKLSYIILVKKIQRISLLNYTDYKKDSALNELKKRLDYREYSGKHYESIFTRFFQGYLLPRKFNYDKRRAHLSVLIISGQISRQDALEKLKEPTYESCQMSEDVEFVQKKFGLSNESWDSIMNGTPKSFNQYPNNNWVFETLMPIFHFFKKLT
jgi:N-acetyl sugar amidotransferase